MVYFKEKLVQQATQMVSQDYIQAAELHEFIDVYNDLCRINQAEQNLFHETGKDTARQLNLELRKKYPIINRMLDIADNLSRNFPSLYNSNPTRTSSNELLYLQQDRCGILCHVLIKKNIIKKIEEFIDYVD